MLIWTSEELCLALLSGVFTLEILKKKIIYFIAVPSILLLIQQLVKLDLYLLYMAQSLQKLVTGGLQEQSLRLVTKLEVQLAAEVTANQKTTSAQMSSGVFLQA